MSDDQIEIPVQMVFIRQSSVETRLSPVHLSAEELSDTDSDEEKPKIVEVQLKPQPSHKINENEEVKSNESTITNRPESTDMKGKTNASDYLRRKSLANALNKNVEIGTVSDIEKDKYKCDTSGVSDDADISLPVNVSPSTMATLRPKSPRPTPTKNDKEESIWDKLGTLGRKKRIKEVQEVEAEGKYAIDSPGLPAALAISPEDYEIDEGEERSIIEPKALNDPKFRELQQVLIDWVNDELSKQRIIVQDLAEDLYDGQVLQKLLEVLTGDKLDAPEVTQSEEAQKIKLNIVLSHFNKILGLLRTGTKKWNVQAIHSKNIIAIMHLLVALARHFRPPVRLTEHVVVPMIVVQKRGGQLHHRFIDELITSAYDDVGMRCERDAFDTLFDQAPEKLSVVKKSMVTFVNKHLNKINLEVSDVDTQFHDGVYLTLLMGLLEGFFVPLHSFHLTPREHEQKVHNVAFAFELMEEVGIQKPKARPEDIVNYDLKSTLRVLYNLFIKYRNIS